MSVLLEEGQTMLDETKHSFTRKRFYKLRVSRSTVNNMDEDQSIITFKDENLQYFLRSGIHISHDHSLHFCPTRPSRAIRNKHPEKYRKHLWIRVRKKR